MERAESRRTPVEESTCRSSGACVLRAPSAADLHLDIGEQRGPDACRSSPSSASYASTSACGRLRLDTDVGVAIRRDEPVAGRGRGRRIDEEVHLLGGRAGESGMLAAAPAASAARRATPHRRCSDGTASCRPAGAARASPAPARRGSHRRVAAAARRDRRRSGHPHSVVATTAARSGSRVRVGDAALRDHTAEQTSCTAATRADGCRRRRPPTHRRPSRVPGHRRAAAMWSCTHRSAAIASCRPRLATSPPSDRVSRKPSAPSR